MFFNLLNADFQYLFFYIIFQRIFQSLDVDKNEKISKDEYVKSMAKVPKIDFKWVYFFLTSVNILKDFFN